MRRSMAVGLVLLVCGGARLGAETRSWLDVGTDWETAANWSPNAVPGAGDVAHFPRETSESNPVVNSDVAVGGIRMQDPYNDDWTITGSGTLTLGTNGVAMLGSRGTCLVGVDLVLSGDQTWYADAEDDRVYGLTVTGALGGTGDLVLDERRGSALFTWAFGDGTARQPADLNLEGEVWVGTSGSRMCEVINNVGPQSASRSFALGGTPAAPTTVHLDGWSVLRFRAAGGAAGLTIGLANDLEIGPAGCRLALQASGTTPTIELSGDVFLGGPVALFRSNVTPEPVYTGIWRLRQDAGATCGLLVDQPGFDLPSYTFSAGLTDGDGDFANPLVALMFQSDLDLTTPAAQVSYAHGTVIDLCGTPYKDATAAARVDVGPGSRLGTGSLVVLPGGKVKLGAAGCLAADGAVDLLSSDTGLGVVGIDYDGMPAVAPSARGVIAIDATYSGSLDLAALGDGGSFLGTTEGGTFAGATLLPAADGIWRLGAGGGAINTLTLSQSALRGNGDLLVGASGWQGNGNLLLAAANAFTGRIDVTGTSYINREPHPTGVAFIGSQLGVRAQASGSPWGDTNGVVALHNSRLYHTQGPSAPLTTRKRQLLFEGRSRVVLDNNNFVSPLALGELVRTNRGSLTLYDTRSSLGVREQLFVGAPPSEASGIVPAWLVHERGPSFLTHDASKGFVDFAGYVADINAAGAGDVVSTGAAALTANRACHAVRITGTLSGAHTLSVGAGGVLLGAAVQCGLDFGAQEGIVYSSTTTTTGESTGSIAGSGGLTLCGNLLYSRAANTFTGPLTLNGCALHGKLDDAAGAYTLGHADNPILLNGGALVQRAGDRILASRTITLGVGGGTLAGSGLRVLAKLTGPGLLTIGAGSYCGEVIVENPANDYTGGTLLLSAGGDRADGRLTVTSTGSLGTGDLAVNSHLRATLKGDANLDANASVQVAAGGRVEFESAAPAVGGLMGSGQVTLGSASQATALHVGGDDVTSTFHGRIVQASAAQAGSLTKVGSGTFTLYGAHAYTGATTVGAGALVLRGSLAGDLDVGPGGTLKVVVDAAGRASLGHVAGDVSLHGALALALPDGYTPPMGMTFTVLTVDGTVSGAPTAVPAGFMVETSGGALTLTRVTSGTLLLMR